MAAISAFRVTQHSQIFSLFFRNRIQCIALYQLHNSQALLNLRRGYYIKFEFRIPDRKLEKLRLKLDPIMQSRIATFRFIAKLAGFLQSLRLAVDPVIR